MQVEEDFSDTGTTTDALTSDQGFSNPKSLESRMDEMSISSEHYYNNEKLSDVTIRYGALGDKTFFGHRAILASRSLWFRKAFEGEHFKESQDKEIVLHGDDPTALEVLLRYCYADTGPSDAVWAPCNTVPTVESGREASEIERLTFNLAVYEVADKYDVPRLLEYALGTFLYNFNNLVWTSQPDPKILDASKNEVLKIIERVYDLTGAQSQSELRYGLVERIANSSYFKVKEPSFGPDGLSYGPQIRWVRDFAEAVPDFARDMLLFILPTEAEQREREERERDRRFEGW